MHGSIFVLHTIHVSLGLHSGIHASRAVGEWNTRMDETSRINLAVITREVDAQDLLVFL